jgi:hypothetical protein
MLQEAGVDLNEIMDEEGFYVPRRVVSATVLPPQGSGSNFGSPLPVQLPTRKELQITVDNAGISLVRRLSSPVFFSTDAEGR